MLPLQDAQRGPMRSRNAGSTEGGWGLIVHRLQNSVGNIADLSVCNSPQEVYVVLKAGFFAKIVIRVGKRKIPFTLGHFMLYCEQ